jgi:hypothetical protein
VNKTLCESGLSPSTCEAGDAKLAVINRISIAVYVNDDHAVIEKLIRSAGVDKIGVSLPLSHGLLDHIRIALARTSSHLPP